jgi:hypothetical protein
MWNTGFNGTGFSLEGRIAFLGGSSWCRQRGYTGEMDRRGAEVSEGTGILGNSSTRIYAVKHAPQLTPPQLRQCQCRGGAVSLCLIGHHKS